jgi:hypothetical protein
MKNMRRMYVGNAVIHLAEPRPAEAPPDLWESQEGGVPTVNPADLKKVWQVSADFKARNPGQSGSIGSTVYQSVCSPGANVVAVWYRASMLCVLEQMMPELLASWTHDGQLDDGVFEVMSTFPVQRMKTGVAREGPPFDVEEFVKQIGART